MQLTCLHRGVWGLPSPGRAEEVPGSSPSRRQGQGSLGAEYVMSWLVPGTRNYRIREAWECTGLAQSTHKRALPPTKDDSPGLGLSRDLPSPRRTKERQRDEITHAKCTARRPGDMGSTPSSARTRRRFRPSWAGPLSPPGCPLVLHCRHI